MQEYPRNHRIGLYVHCLLVAVFMLHLRSASTFRTFVRPGSFLGIQRSTVPRAVQTCFASTHPDPENNGAKTTSSSLLRNFIANIIEADLAVGKNGGRVVTRFPPEPNGYLHLGHAKSVNFNFGIAKHFGGTTHMRFDDTNPAKEDMEYVLSILDDVRWLITGNTSVNSEPWDGKIRHASDYFHDIYNAAEYLIQQDMAYVDELTPQEMKEYRGTLTEPGKNSPFRSRSIEENMRLFREMRAGKFPDGHCVLRAKIDMTSPNMNMRDPTLYRIKKDPHPITGDQWCIYPMYDFAHAISDAMEGITHSLCTLEFAVHRPLYDWTIDSLEGSGILPFQQEKWRPNQYEFSRLNLQYTVLSKRKLIQLVTEKHVSGWDDPRMPTISGLRRRGYPSEAIKLFCDRVGISKVESNIDMSVLEDCAREILDETALRAFAITDPLKVTLTNRDSALEVEYFEIEKHPKLPGLGTRKIPFTSELYISRDDFFDTGTEGKVSPPKGYKRLLPGGTVRLKNAYVIKCDDVIRDATGKVIELKCSFDSATRAGANPEGSLRAKGIVQWLSCAHAVPVQINLYDRLFNHPSPGSTQPDGNYLLDINPSSLQVLGDAFVEPSLAGAAVSSTFQFERVGYFVVDKDSKPNGKLIFNRIVTLKDTWANNVNSSPQPSSNSSVSNGKDQKAQDSIEDIRRLELRVGKIVSIEKHPDAENLYVEKIDCGEQAGTRTVVSGLAKYIPMEQLLHKKVVVLCNLKPAKMRGILSEGMLLAASSTSKDANDNDQEMVEVLTPPDNAEVGELIFTEGFEPPSPDEQLRSKSAQEVWKRVSSDLKTTSSFEASYKSINHKLVTKAGPCKVTSLRDAVIR